jgi:HD superfamily phosphodiesterase
MDFFLTIKNKVIKLLSSKLDKRLCYHNIQHTLDVVMQAERIALGEGIIDEKKILLLKMAALFHDSGFIYTYIGHEEKGCEIARELIVNKEINAKEMKIITETIMATKIPHKPTTQLQRIICDADLDYLGRDDYKIISTELKNELLNYGFIKTDAEWLKMQISFFESHIYFTKTSTDTRLAKKLSTLTGLKNK